jgi:cell division protein FtsB
MQPKLTRNTVLSVVLLILAASSITVTLQVAHRGRRLVEARTELAALRQEKERLDAEVLYRQSADFVEQEARNKLNMVRPGEEVYLKPKISGDDLLGAQDSQGANQHSRGGIAAGLLAPVKGMINSLIDKINDFLVLFQS